MVLQILLALEAFAIDADSLLAELDLSRNELNTPDHWTSAATVDALWNQAASMSGNEHFGARAAATLEPHHLGAFGYVVAASANVGEAMERLIRFKRLTGDVSTGTLHVENGRARYIHETPLPPLSQNRHHSEWCLAAFVSLLRQVTGQRTWQPHEVTFTHAAPKNAEHIQEVFGCAPTFGAPHESIVMDVEFLATPFLGADRVLSQLLESHATALLSKLPTEKEFLAALRSGLQRELPGGSPTVERLADTMNLSVRSLQRRLEEEGCTFQHVLDEMRESLADSYLRNAAMSVTEVAFLLGYGDASTFARAFKRWHQVSPTTWRNCATPAP